MEKMIITPCELDDDGNIKEIDTDQAKKNQDTLQVLINPSTITHNHSISYSKKDKPQGTIGKEMKFQAVDPEDVSFDLIFDGTGVIPSLSDGKTIDVKEQIDKFKNIAYNFKGGKHEPWPVRLGWGSFLFYGRLKSLSLEYTLFKPTGEPLRAKTKLSFSKYISTQEAALRANKSSPDLTHLVEVQAGDTLPLLCQRIYRNPAYYPEVARINGLNSPQALHPGLKLKFPPLS